MTYVDTPAPAPQQQMPAGMPQPPGGERLVIYHWCFSVVILSFKRASGVKVIRPGEGRILPGLPYSVVTLIAGWWGIPWGPIWTIQALVKNFRGGTDVTDELYAAALQAAAAAESPPR